MQSLIIRISKTGLGLSAVAFQGDFGSGSTFQLHFVSLQHSAIGTAFSGVSISIQQPISNCISINKIQSPLSPSANFFMFCFANHFLFCLQNPTCIMFRFQLIFDPYGKAYRYHQWAQPQSAGQA
jgi:hypothetical protein